MEIIYQDDEVIVIDKPAGISVHPRAGENAVSTIAAAIRNQVVDSDQIRPGIVHRLDKDTSGVLIIAKNPKTKAFLQAQFKSRQVNKTYLALVHGHLDKAHAIIELPIGRHPKNPLKRAVKAGGKPAITEYKVIKQFKEYALVEARPKTGRTHQIRVHFARVGHPIVGDSLYGKTDPELDRHFLHAHKLKIVLPGGQVEEFTASLPQDLQKYLDRLQ